MATEAVYTLEIDWNNDGNLTALPSTDLHSWDISVGGVDDDFSPTPSAGIISLYNPDGRYQRPGTYSASQLRGVHRFRFRAAGELQMYGRASPAAALPLLNTVEPAAWILEADATPAMLTRDVWDLPAGSVQKVAAAISAQSGATVHAGSFGRLAMQDLGAINWRGTLTGLLGRLAVVLGGWAVQDPSGQVLLIESNSAHATSPSWTLDAASVELDAYDTRVGQRTDLVRTVAVLPETADHDRLVLNVGDTATYGRRGLTVERWYTTEIDEHATDLAETLSVFGEPWIEIDASMRDIVPAAGASALVQQCRHVTPARVLAVRLPNGLGGTSSYTALVVGVRLTNGVGPALARRSARMVVTHNRTAPMDQPATPDAPAGAVNLAGWDVTLTWDPAIGPVDIACAPTGERGAEVQVVASGVTGGSWSHAPGAGVWDYRIRPTGTNNWSDWLTGVTTTAAPPTPPTPALTYDADALTVTVTWPNTDNADIARAPTGERGALVEVVATDVASDHVDPIPGEGVWDYRLRQHGVWGPWAEITAEPHPVVVLAGFAGNWGHPGDFDGRYWVRPTAVFSDRTWVIATVDNDGFSELVGTISIEYRDTNWTAQTWPQGAELTITSEGTAYVVVVPPFEGVEGDGVRRRFPAPAGLGLSRGWTALESSYP